MEFLSVRVYIRLPDLDLVRDTVVLYLLAPEPDTLSVDAFELFWSAKHMLWRTS
jgi:hypothetical protein